MRTITFINQKGGVAKTTTCINVGDGLYLLNKKFKVLLIDLDPQGHLTNGIGIQLNDTDRTIYSLLKGEATREDITIQARPHIDVIPAGIELSGADIELSGMANRHLLLKQAMEGLSGYDYVLVDCSPSLNLLTVNALNYVKEVIIPIQAEYLALHGLRQLLDTVEIIQESNRGLYLTGVVVTRYDSRLKLHNEVIEQLKAFFGNKVFNAKIRPSISLAEAPSAGKTIFEYKPNSNGAKDYIELCKEIIKGGMK